LVCAILTVMCLPGCRQPTAADSIALGDECRAVGDLQGAAACYTEAIGRDPDLAVAYVRRGFAYADLDDNERALSDFERALELEPNSYDVRLRRAELAEENGRPDDAIADLTVVIEAGHELGHSLTMRGRLYLAGRKFREALRDLDSALEIEAGRTPQCYVLRGRARMECEDGKGEDADFSQAEADFSQAIELDSDFALAYWSRAQVRDKMQRTTDADADRRRAQELDPGLIFSTSDVSKGLIRELYTPSAARGEFSPLDQ